MLGRLSRARPSAESWLLLWERASFTSDCDIAGSRRAQLPGFRRRAKRTNARPGRAIRPPPDYETRATWDRCHQAEAVREDRNDGSSIGLAVWRTRRVSIRFEGLSRLLQAVASLDDMQRREEIPARLRVDSTVSLDLPSTVRGPEPALFVAWPTDLVVLVANDLVLLDREFRRATALLEADDRLPEYVVRRGGELVPRPISPDRGALAMLSMDSGSADIWVALTGAIADAMLSRPLQLLITAQWLWAHRTWFTGARLVLPSAGDPVSQARELVTELRHLAEQRDVYFQIRQPGFDLKFRSQQNPRPGVRR